MGSVIGENENKVDFLSRIISAFVPAVVTECAKRSKEFAQLKTKESQMQYAEKLSGEIISECDFTIENDEEGNTLVNIASDSNEELTHLQNLKVDLYELYNELYKEFSYKIKLDMSSEIEKIKDDIKTELRMEMNMEFNNMNEKLEEIKSTQSEPAYGALKDFGAEVIPKFSFDTSDSVTPVMNGFESIANKVTFDMPRVIDDNEAEQILQNNPIFAKVSKSLERNKKGAPAYTVDEFVEAREGRFDNKSIDEFKNRMKNLQVDYEEEDEYEKEQWDKLAKDRFNQDL
ncbi:Hypothetical protein PACV_297 [Pacmanvirus A23]|uniref:Hypothetical protein n=1 Tax=Pacmanvirus A23 TaxID=1932881 RepID=UPI000A0927F1|nr:Hypothetical protein B9W72_gp293 [Pacmanvirus A23]SIP86010.1 Hypothetical protein PACV_297 [Pacmanvirus A23]